MNASQKLIDTAYDLAIQAALQASQAMMPFWPNPQNSAFDDQRALELTQKEGIGNYATIADLRSEEKIIEVITSNPLMKSHSILAEESGEMHGDKQWRWSIDPIDGTMNFRSGNPDFGICIALFEGDRAVVGLIAMPALQQFVAVKDGENAGLFSYRGDQIADLSALAARHNDHLDNALVGYNLGYTDRENQLQDIAAKLITKVGYAASLGSYSTGNFRLLQGMMGAYFGMSPTVMDIAPVAALLPAVGGVVTDLQGSPIDWSAPSRTYLGTVNRQIHEEFLLAMNGQ